MLSEFQQKAVWEHWLGAEIRGNYFADLSHTYTNRQKWFTWLTLLLSSGAFAALIGNWVPPQFGWIKPVLPFLTAVISITSLVEQNQKKVTDTADLHLRWNRIATEYESLWNNIYSENAASRFEELAERRAELSKSGLSFPNDEKRMLRWEGHVLQHRAPGYQMPVAV